MTIHRRLENIPPFIDIADSDCHTPYMMEFFMFVFSSAAVYVSLARVVGQRTRGIPMCEVELRPYMKPGRKKARELPGCARILEKHDPDKHAGVFHKFFKMDFVVANPSESKDGAETSPTFLATIYAKINGEKVVAGRAEVLLASLCGYKSLNGEAVLRHGPGQSFPAAHNSKSPKYCSPRGGRPRFRTSGVVVDDIGAACPVVAVDKVIPLLDNEGYDFDRRGDHEGVRGARQGGQLRLRALYVPDRLADMPGVRSAIKVNIREG